MMRVADRVDGPADRESSTVDVPPHLQALNRVLIEHLLPLLGELSEQINARITSIARCTSS